MDSPSPNRPANEISDPVERKKIDMRKREAWMKEHLELRRRQARMKGVTP